MSGALFWLCLLAQTDDGSKDKPAPESKAIEAFKKEAAEYVIRLDDKTKSLLTLDSKPILHWSNPARTAEDGAVFVWMRDGRPEVIGSIFTYKIETVRTKHEFHSLSTSPLTAEFNRKLAWKPNQAGVKFEPIPQAPAPAENARQRQVQMKALAQKFSAIMKSLEGESSELRLMPQPLYRYEPKGGDVLDGALFSFALGTDPEVLLLIEARQKKGEWQWHYAFARFNYYELTASMNGEQVWHVEADRAQPTLVIGDTIHRVKVYSSFHVE